jgi:ureidoacrylate peracid hydrolase
MHRVNIPPDVVERVIRHRGREHVYDNFDPAKTALLVVDMQNAFMMPGVAHVLCAEAINIVPNINRLAEAMRAAGGTVVWVVTTFGQASLENWPVLHEMAGAERTPARIAALAEGSVGHQLWTDLVVEPNDLTIVKTKYSAFIQSSLEPTLRQRGIDTLLVTGTVTGVCCESTARDAMMRNFRTVMVTDANAAMTDEDHNASLRAFYLSFGDIFSTDQIVAHLQTRRNATRRQAARRARPLTRKPAVAEQSRKETR